MDGTGKPHESELVSFIFLDEYARMLIISIVILLNANCGLGTGLKSLCGLSPNSLTWWAPFPKWGNRDSEKKRNLCKVTFPGRIELRNEPVYWTPQSWFFIKSAVDEIPLSLKRIRPLLNIIITITHNNKVLSICKLYLHLESHWIIKRARRSGPLFSRWAHWSSESLNDSRIKKHWLGNQTTLGPNSGSAISIPSTNNLLST